MDRTRIPARQPRMRRRPVVAGMRHRQNQRQVGVAASRTPAAALPVDLLDSSAMVVPMLDDVSRNLLEAQLALGKEDGAGLLRAADSAAGKLSQGMVALGRPTDGTAPLFNLLLGSSEELGDLDRASPASAGQTLGAAVGRVEAMKYALRFGGGCMDASRSLKSALEFFESGLLARKPSLSALNFKAAEALFEHVAASPVLEAEAHAPQRALLLNAVLETKGLAGRVDVSEEKRRAIGKLQGELSVLIRRLIHAAGQGAEAGGSTFDETEPVPRGLGSKTEQLLEKEQAVAVKRSIRQLKDADIAAEQAKWAKEAPERAKALFKAIPDLSSAHPVAASFFKLLTTQVGSGRTQVIELVELPTRGPFAGRRTLVARGDELLIQHKPSLGKSTLFRITKPKDLVGIELKQVLGAMARVLEVAAEGTSRPYDLIENRGGPVDFPELGKAKWNNYQCVVVDGVAVGMARMSRTKREVTKNFLLTAEDAGVLALELLTYNDVPVPKRFDVYLRRLMSLCKTWTSPGDDAAQGLRDILACEAMVFEPGARELLELALDLADNPDLAFREREAGRSPTEKMVSRRYDKHVSMD